VVILFAGNKSCAIRNIIIKILFNDASLKKMQMDKTSIEDGHALVPWLLMEYRNVTVWCFVD
jgi:hypothetical protein